MRESLLALLLLFAGTSGASAQASRVWISKLYDAKTKTEIRVTPLINQVPPSGYMPFRVFIRNGYPIDRTWEFKFRSYDEDYNGRGNDLRSDFSATCESMKTVEFDLLVPLITAFGSYSDYSVELELVISATALGNITDSMLTEYVPEWPSVMISDSLDTANRGTLNTALNSALTGGGPSSSRYGGAAYDVEFGGSFLPKQLPEDWRAYSGFDACLLTESDWRDLSPGARNALLRWNRLGGSILIFATNPSTTLATLPVPGAITGDREAVRSWGEIRIISIQKSLIMDSPGDTVDLIRLELPSRTGANRLQTLHEDFSKFWPLQISFGEKTTNIVFFILVLIAFGVLVGPVNLFVFARAGQRHRLFITTPIISLGASLLLVVLIIFQDGFGGRGQRLVLMEVQAGDSENSAYISQEQISRTGVLLSTGFKTSEPGTFTPVLIAESRWARVTEDNFGGQGRYTVDVEDDGLNVSGDWFQSRSEHGHLFETVLPTRGRITLVESAPAPVINSTFEFPLETLWYRDAVGALWRADGIEQGRNILLTPVPSNQDFNTWIKSETNRFTARNQKRLELTADKTNYFFATTDEAEGIDTLSSINWQQTHTVLTGPVAP